MSSTSTRLGGDRSSDEGDLIELTSRLVAVNSMSGNEGPCATIVADFCHEHGIACERQEVERGRWNLNAWLDGDGPTLLLNGHLDIVETTGDWTTDDPFRLERRGDCLIGSGVCNMKAQVAAMAVALRALQRSGARHCPVLLSAVVGECKELGLGTKAFVSRGGTADFAIVGEPTRLAALPAHGGTYRSLVRFEGIPSHTSRIDEGVNANEAAAHFVLDLRTHDLVPAGEGPFEGFPRALGGQMRGGFNANVTAPEAEVWCDVRLPYGVDEATIATAVDELADRCAGRVGAGWSRRSLTYAPAYTMGPAGNRFVSVLKDAFDRATGRSLGAEDETRYFATDAAHLEAGGIPSLVFGPGRWVVGPDESISLSETLEFARTLKEFAALLCDERTSEPEDASEASAGT